MVLPHMGDWMLGVLSPAKAPLRTPPPSGVFRFRGLPMLRYLLAALAVLAVLFYGRGLFAEDNNLSVTAPAELENGEPLTDLAAINFYHKIDDGPYGFLARVDWTEPGARVSYLHADQGDGAHCYYATAVRAGGQESVPSNEACKTVDTLLPGSPSGMTVN